MPCNSKCVKTSLPMPPSVHFATFLLYEEPLLHFVPITGQNFRQLKKSSTGKTIGSTVVQEFVESSSERLIRSLKNAMYAITGSKILTDDNFNTVLCEFEQFMKARPKSTDSSIPIDIEALTPNHFLSERMFTSIPPKLSTPLSTITKQ